MSNIAVINDSNNFAPFIFRKLCEFVDDCFSFERIVEHLPFLSIWTGTGTREFIGTSCTIILLKISSLKAGRWMEFPSPFY